MSKKLVNFDKLVSKCEKIKVTFDQQDRKSFNLILN